VLSNDHLFPASDSNVLVLGTIGPDRGRKRPHLTGPTSIPVARVLDPVVRPFSLGSEAGIDRDLLEGSGHAQSVGHDIVDGCDEGDESSAQGFQGATGVKQGERRLTTGDDVMVQDDPPALTVDVVVSLLRLPNGSA
jgi:hypothetical protein